MAGNSGQVRLYDPDRNFDISSDAGAVVYDNRICLYAVDAVNPFSAIFG